MDRVLTDYHLHLRPDEVGSAEEYFTHESHPVFEGLELPRLTVAVAGTNRLGLAGAPRSRSHAKAAAQDCSPAAAAQQVVSPRTVV